MDKCRGGLPSPAQAAALVGVQTISTTVKTGQRASLGMVPPIDLLLFDPESFFESEKWNRWAGPAAVLGVLVVVRLLAAYPAYQITHQMVGGLRGGSIAVFISIGTVVLLAVLVPVYWLLVSVTAFGVGSWFDGDGGFSMTAQAIAWGFVPHVIGTLVSVARRYIRYLRMEVPHITAEMSRQEIQQLAGQVRGEPTDPINLIVTLVGLVMLFWSGYLWTVGIAEGHGIERRHAVIAVAPWIALPLLVTVVRYVLALV